MGMTLVQHCFYLHSGWWRFLPYHSFIKQKVYKPVTKRYELDVFILLCFHNVLFEINSPFEENVKSFPPGKAEPSHTAAASASHGEFLSPAIL